MEGPVTLSTIKSHTRRVVIFYLFLTFPTSSALPALPTCPKSITQHGLHPARVGREDNRRTQMSPSHPQRMRSHLQGFLP
ncbi:hypothetical protein F5146DRAFT_1073859 [Armillaria mellea]|nr:hypothetical protein F5146DRAFT_1073859 [Armillaria mellea]